MGRSYGWTGRTLWVDLSEGTVEHLDTLAYVPDYVGGLGVAARLAWEHLSLGTGPFDPGNLLMIMTGPLTGTLASGASRVEVAGIAPQQRPPVFSRSGMGGHWGAELKYAGYDGIVVTGQAPEPVYLWIENERVEIRPAGDLWGAGNYAVTRTLRARHGPRTRIVSCGPAGEALSRIAVIQTETGNAAGQGGYGGVMGSKRLKAIAVRGTGGVAVAQPERLLELCVDASREGQAPYSHGIRNWGLEGARMRKCGFCMTPCAHPIYIAGPQVEGAGGLSAARQCWSYDGIPRETDNEARMLTTDYGLNGWEISYGIIPWLQMCRQAGLIDAVGAQPIPVPDQPIEYLRDVANYPIEFVRELLRLITQREGELGDALAEGACYAAERLFDGAGEPLLDRIYPRRAGQTEHWGGNWGPGGVVYWPWWLPVVLQWCVDTRDPASDSSHQWTMHAQHYLPQSGPNQGPFPLEQVRAISERVYGNPDVCDPAYAYDPPEAKAIPAIWHTDRAMVVDSLVLCDYEHSRVFSVDSEDGMADVDLPAKLFSACTGHELGRDELDRAGERIWNLLRAIDVRDFGRERAVDESALNTFLFPGKDDGVLLDRERFMPLLDSYYELRGWNLANGWPTEARLRDLGLEDVAIELARHRRLG